MAELPNRAKGRGVSDPAAILTVFFVAFVAVFNLLLGYGTHVLWRKLNAPAPPEPAGTEPFPEEVPEESPELAFPPPAPVTPSAPVTPPEPKAPVAPAEPELSREHVVFERLAGGLTTLWQQLRAQEPAYRAALDVPALPLLQSFATELLAIVEGANRKFGPARETLEPPLEPAEPTRESARTTVLAIVGRWTETLAQTTQTLAQVTLQETDVSAGATRLAEIYRSLWSTSFATRDELVAPLTVLVRERVQPHRLSDEAADLRALAGRMRFEAAMKPWEADPAQAAQPLSVALLDVDHTQNLNARFDELRVDILAERLAEKLDESLANPARLFPLGGLRWGVFAPDSRLGDIAAVIERTRQAAATVRPPDAPELAATLSAAVCQWSENDTVVALVERLQTTLREAKNAGGNQTYLFTDQPTPVVPLPPSE